mmetsp:Transcript_14408/g.39349  ORF Transcript_14408/g.39349 Transcript_14408/m.39349 type:complete len:216 (-) Transcript_14408:113-760(-)
MSHLRFRGDCLLHCAAPSQSTSFFVDCSTEFPAGFAPEVWCPKHGCQSHEAECARIRHMVEKKTLVQRHWSCRDETFVHVVDGDLWMRCCAKGKGDPDAVTCELLQEPPAVGQTWSAWGRIGAALRHRVRCGLSSCEATGTSPAPHCLRSLGGFAGHCVHEGRPGDLYPDSPAEGPRDYKVFQLSLFAPEQIVAVSAFANGHVSRTLRSRCGTFL